ncbi:hypothetical protein [Eleftheria terrae]|nr:hypothetical protein [Eleftheria terrae]WKB55646.1 hypothetical protein N7L95_26610 [Eleftheria terrae]
MQQMVQPGGRNSMAAGGLRSGLQRFGPASTFGRLPLGMAASH